MLRPRHGRQSKKLDKCTGVVMLAALALGRCVSAPDYREYRHSGRCVRHSGLRRSAVLTVRVATVRQGYFFRGKPHRAVSATRICLLWSRFGAAPSRKGCPARRRNGGQASRLISTGWLKPSPVLHLLPIDPVVFRVPLAPLARRGRPRLRGGLALRCFQRFSFRDIATRRCP